MNSRCCKSKVKCNERQRCTKNCQDCNRHQRRCSLCSKSSTYFKKPNLKHCCSSEKKKKKSSKKKCCSSKSKANVCCKKKNCKKHHVTANTTNCGIQNVMDHDFTRLGCHKKSKSFYYHKYRCLQKESNNKTNEDKCDCQDDKQIGTDLQNISTTLVCEPKIILGRCLSKSKYCRKRLNLPQKEDIKKCNESTQYSKIQTFQRSSSYHKNHSKAKYFKRCPDSNSSSSSVDSGNKYYCYRSRAASEPRKFSENVVLQTSVPKFRCKSLSAPVKSSPSTVNFCDVDDSNISIECDFLRKRGGSDCVTKPHKKGKNYQRKSRNRIARSPSSSTSSSFCEKPEEARKTIKKSNYVVEFKTGSIPKEMREGSKEKRKREKEETKLRSNKLKKYKDKPSSKEPCVLEPQKNFYTRTRYFNKFYPTENESEEMIIAPPELNQSPLENQVTSKQIKRKSSSRNKYFLKCKYFRNLRRKMTKKKKSKKESADFEVQVSCQPDQVQKSSTQSIRHRKKLSAPSQKNPLDNTLDNQKRFRSMNASINPIQTSSERLSHRPKKLPNCRFEEEKLPIKQKYKLYDSKYVHESAPELINDSFQNLSAYYLWNDANLKKNRENYYFNYPKFYNERELVWKYTKYSPRRRTRAGSDTFNDDESFARKTRNYDDFPRRDQQCCSYSKENRRNSQLSEGCCQCSSEEDINPYSNYFPRRSKEQLMGNNMWENNDRGSSRSCLKGKRNQRPSKELSTSCERRHRLSFCDSSTSTYRPYFQYEDLTPQTSKINCKKKANFKCAQRSCKSCGQPLYPKDHPDNPRIENRYVNPSYNLGMDNRYDQRPSFNSSNHRGRLMADNSRNDSSDSDNSVEEMCFRPRRLVVGKRRSKNLDLTKERAIPGCSKNARQEWEGSDIQSGKSKYYMKSRKCQVHKHKGEKNRNEERCSKKTRSFNRLDRNYHVGFSSCDYKAISMGISSTDNVYFANAKKKSTANQDTKLISYLKSPTKSNQYTHNIDTKDMQSLTKNLWSCSNLSETKKLSSPKVTIQLSDKDIAQTESKKRDETLKNKMVSNSSIGEKKNCNQGFPNCNPENKLVKYWCECCATFVKPKKKIRKTLFTECVTNMLDCCVPHLKVHVTAYVCPKCGSTLIKFVPENKSNVKGCIKENF